MRYILRIILGLIGVGILFLGLNIGLGGIQTLGWQGAGPFITITDMDAGTFNWGNGKFPLMSQPSAAYHGLVHWDAFGFGNLSGTV